VRDLGGDVEGVIGEEAFEAPAVGPEGGDALLPGLGRGWSGRLGPIHIGPLQRAVARVHAEIQDVALSEAQVFKQLPRRVGQALGLHAPKARGKALDRGIKIHMRILPVEQCGKMGSEAVVSGH